MATTASSSTTPSPATEARAAAVTSAQSDRSAPPTPSGRRDAEATKAAIIRAARYLLARHAHGDITLKAVAERAGVSPPLILKYFGNKDALFSHVMSFEVDADAFFDAPVDGLGAHMVRHVLTGQAERGADPILRIVFAPLHGEQGDILRANFRTQVAHRLSERLPGPDAGLRAELAVGMLIGLGVMYGIARGPCLRGTGIDEVTGRYAPAVQALLTPQ
ncbi:TetR family transcriptional regulator [Streptomyces kanamyceticus]|uniref:TetR/AcrR family transcriptional regulator n=1 Tax=Streptomyces kanamyceticus TaxID=1967 RepID=A0A5J6GRS8_STRKN|nr:TetR family transcriptional regulator [Streptomyces kanamyceticus]QEU96508.1 TetR/AcrR family transcriptional regulator [Streptomyces kanamyceticus]